MRYKIKKYCPNFEKLKIKFTDTLRKYWIGDWDSRKNQIMIYNKLKDIDKVGVVIHEFIEMIATTMLGIPDCCDNKYKQGIHGKKNELAHNIANRVERRILELGGYSWKAHERRCKRFINEKKKIYQTQYKI